MQIGSDKSILSALSAFSNVSAAKGSAKVATSGQTDSDTQKTGQPADSQSAQATSGDVPSGRRGSLVNLLV